MSTEIDEKVVSMTFDNRRFEANVKESMNTLDDLKKSLKFDKTKDSFEEITKAAKKVDLSPISQATQTVTASFSKMEMFTYSVMNRMVNDAITKGKQIISALTVDPVKTGMSEYKLKMGSVQTIMAATGEELKTVNKYLEELNEYSDRTIYSFSDMTSNIGKFTNAGVKLDKAVTAIKGISNVAAVSGATANEASRAMYNFSQALSSGYVKLIDWKSIELANMATEDFKQNLIDTAVELGVISKSTNGMYKTMKGKLFNATKNFNDVLQDQWMTTDVLIETLQKYTDETTDIGKKAYASAQDVKTLSMMFDTLKEAVQSSWAQSWELLMGDFEEGKKTFTGFSNALSDFIGRISNARNYLLMGGLGSQASNWEKIEGAVVNAGVSVDDFRNKLIETAKKYKPEVAKIIAESKDFEDSLTKGWLNSSVVLEVFNDYLVESETNSTKYTKTQIENLQELVRSASRTDGIIHNLIANVDAYGKATGRENIWSGIANIFKALQRAASIIMTSLRMVFDSIDAKNVYELTQGFEKFTKGLYISNEAAVKIIKTLNGVFSLMKLGYVISKEVLSIIYRVFSELFGVTINSLLDLTSVIGEVVFKISTFIQNTGMIPNVIRTIKKAVLGLVDTIKIFLKNTFGIESFGQVLYAVGYALGKILGIVSKIVSFIVRLVDIPRLLSIMANVFTKIFYIGKNIVSGLASVFTGPKAKELYKKIGSFVNGIIDKIKDVLEIHSPSRVMIWIGSMLVAGLIIGVTKSSPFITQAMDGILGRILTFLGALENPITAVIGLLSSIISSTINYLFNDITTSSVKILGSFSSGLTKLGGGVKGALSPLTESLSKINWTAIGTIAVFTALFAIVFKVLKILGTFTGFLGKFGDFLSDVGYTIRSFGKALRGLKNMLNAKALLYAAGAIGILTASIIAFTLLPDNAIDKIEMAGKAIAQLALIAVGIATAFTILSKFSSIGNSAKTALSLMGTVALFIGLTLALKTVLNIWNEFGDINNADFKEKISKVAQVLGLVAGMYLVLMGGLRLAGNFASKAAIALLSVLISMLVIKKIIDNVSNVLKSMSPQEAKRFTNNLISTGAIILTGLVLFFASTRTAGEYAEGAGKAFRSITTAVLAITAALWILSALNWKKAHPGLIAILAIFGAFAGIAAIVKYSGTNADKLGKMFLSIGGSILILTAAIALLGIIPNDILRKGGTFVAGLLLLVALIAKAAKGAHSPTSTFTGIALMILGIGAIISSFMLISKDLNQRQMDFVITAMAIFLAGIAAIIWTISKLPKKTSKVKKNVKTVAKDVKDTAKESSGINSAFATLSGLALVIAAFGGSIALILSTSDSWVEMAVVGGIMIAGLATIGIIMSAFNKMKSRPINKNLIANIAAISGAMLAFAASVAILSSLDLLKMGVSAGVLAVFIVGLSHVMKSLSSVKFDAKKTTNLYTIAAIFTSMAVSMILIATAITMLESLDLLKMGVSAGVLTVFIAAIAIVINSFSKINAKKMSVIITAASAFVGITASLLLIAAAISILSNIDGDKLQSSTMALGILAALMAGIIYVFSTIDASKMPIIIAASASFVGIAAAMLLIAGAILMLGNMDTDKITAASDALLSLSGLIGILIIAGAMISSAGGLALAGMPVVAASFVIVAAGLLVAAQAMLSLGSLDNDKIKAATVAMQTIITASMIFLAIGGVLAALSALSLAGILVMSISFVIMAAGLANIGNAMAGFAQHDAAAISKGGAVMCDIIYAALALFAVGGALGALTLAGGAGLFAIMGVLVIAAAFNILAEGITSIIQSFANLAAVGPEAVMAGAMAILTVLGGVIAILSEYSGLFGGLEMAQMIGYLFQIGGALTIVASAILLLATGFNIMDFSLKGIPTSIDNVTNAIRKLLDEMPSLIASLAVCGETVVKLMTDGLVSSIEMAIPVIESAIEIMFTAMTNAMLHGMYDMYNKMNEQMYIMTNLGKSVVGHFGLGMSDKEGAIALYKSGNFMGNTVIDALKASLGIHSPSTEAQETGKNVLRGLLLPLTGDDTLKVFEAMYYVGEGMSKSLNESLEIRSPSRVTMRTGEEAINGLILGIGNRITALNDAIIMVNDTMFTVGRTNGKTVTTSSARSYHDNMGNELFNELYSYISLQNKTLDNINNSISYNKKPIDFDDSTYAKTDDLPALSSISNNILSAVQSIAQDNSLNGSGKLSLILQALQNTEYESKIYDILYRSDVLEVVNMERFVREYIGAEKDIESGTYSYNAKYADSFINRLNDILWTDEYRGNKDTTPIETFDTNYEEIISKFNKLTLDQQYSIYKDLVDDLVERTTGYDVNQVISDKNMSAIENILNKRSDILTNILAKEVEIQNAENSSESKSWLGTIKGWFGDMTGGLMGGIESVTGAVDVTDALNGFLDEIKVNNEQYEGFLNGDGYFEYDSYDPNSWIGAWDNINSDNLTTDDVTNAINNSNIGAAASAQDKNAYTFVQNNYSPKALSSIEIYRQTKNQLSVAGRRGW